ncbi:hypothetical protein Scep_014980 [Stephania cephalantha]|uniref:Uncharacterized protein n=1 Tax=Stephania cephalantha TaxID=152367 RepID=A0AAP0J2A1_9MAGN
MGESTNTCLEDHPTPAGDEKKSHGFNEDMGDSKRDQPFFDRVIDTEEIESNNRSYEASTTYSSSCLLSCCGATDEGSMVEDEEINALLGFYDPVTPPHIYEEFIYTSIIVLLCG